MKQRIEWIDLAKGISIILVVYGHCGLNSVPFIGKWFCAFRMPFFFFVSGLLFNVTKYPTVASFIKRRWKTLYRPYFIFSSILLLIFAIDDHQDFPRYLLDVTTFGWRGIALWFIPVLSATELLYFFIAHNYHRLSLRICLLIGCAVAGYTAYLLELPNNYNLWFALTGVFFYGAGNIIGKHLNNLSARNLSSIIVAIVCFMLLSFCFVFNDAPEFGVNNLQTLWTYPAAIFGTLFMCSVAILVSKSNIRPIRWAKQIIKFFGKNSYIVLAFHQIILLCLHNTGLYSNGSLQRLSMWIILVALIILINNYLPWVLGKQVQK